MEKNPKEVPGMELRVLTVGDVVGPAGVAFLGKRLRALKREKHIGF